MRIAITSLRARLICAAFIALNNHLVLERFSTLAMAIEIVVRGSVSRRLRIRQVMRYRVRRRRIDAAIDAGIAAVEAERRAYLDGFRRRFSEKHLKGMQDPDFANLVNEFMSEPLQLDGRLRANERYE